jgi:hypothetical protein
VGAAEWEPPKYRGKKMQRGQTTNLTENFLQVEKRAATHTKNDGAQKEKLASKGKEEKKSKRRRPLTQKRKGQIRFLPLLFQSFDVVFNVRKAAHGTIKHEKYEEEPPQPTAFTQGHGTPPRVLIS